MTLSKCETCHKDLTVGLERFCGNECRDRFIEGLRKGTPTASRAQSGLETSPAGRLSGRVAVYSSLFLIAFVVLFVAWALDAFVLHRPAG